MADRHGAGMDPRVIALDVGGTKLEAGLVDHDGAILRRVVASTPASEPAELWETVTRLVDEVASDAGPVVAVGVGAGGPMTAGGELLSPLNIPAWRGFPLKERLSDHLGIAAYVDNDAKALALGEGWRGAARGVADYLAMVVSTGVGGGIVLGGVLVDGAAGNAGHIGHVIVEPDGRPCRCGAAGCLEAEASGTAIAEITGRPAREAPVERRVRTGTLVGRAVASVANLLDLRLAVVAGSVALGFGDVFIDAAQAELDRSACLEFSRGARIRPAGCGRDGPLIGAAAVGFRGHGLVVTHG